jgi:hypothetical protein
MPHDTKLVNMKIDPKEREKKYAESAVTDRPLYPYGLALHLDDDVMSRLGMATLPQVGKQVLVYALADVVSVSEHESTGDDGKQQSVSLQITDLALLPPPKNEDAGEKLYKG